MNKNIGSEYVKDEYLCLHETVQNYDSKLITIKAWSVTVGMAGPGTDFLQKNSTTFPDGRNIISYFLDMDAMWRKYQVLFNCRILELEGELVPFQISSSFPHYRN
jgi:hypothetical protein